MQTQVRAHNEEISDEDILNDPSLLAGLAPSEKAQVDALDAKGKAILEKEKADKEAYDAETARLRGETQQPDADPDAGDSEIPTSADEPIKPATPDYAAELEQERQLRIKAENDRKAAQGRMEQLSKERREMKRQLREAEEKRAEAETRKTEPTPEDLMDLLDPEEREDMSPAALRGVSKLIKHALTPFQQQNQAALDRVYEAETRNQASDFNEDNPEFDDWLDNEDVVTGQSRRDLLEAARKARDPRRTAALWRQFRPESPANPDRPSQQRPSVMPETVATQRSREAPKPNQPKVWLESEIRSIQNKIDLGKYSDAEADRLTHEIDHAVAQGRVRSG